MPNRPENHGKVVFFHIPKTGGMTFRGILQSIYGASFHVCSDPTVAAVVDALKKFDCLEFHADHYQGEYPYMLRDLAASDRWDVLDGTLKFTMLRDPLEQVVSHYYQLVEERKFVEKFIYGPTGTRFPESLEEYVDAGNHANTQLHFLLGNRDRPPLELGRDDLDRAKKLLLAQGVHVGLTERYSDSVHILENVIERKVPDGKIENRQQNRKRMPLDQIPERIKNKIRKHDQLDLELYEFGRSLFEQDVRCYGKGHQYSFSSGRFADKSRWCSLLSLASSGIASIVHGSQSRQKHDSSGNHG